MVCACTWRIFILRSWRKLELTRCVCGGGDESGLCILGEGVAKSQGVAAGWGVEKGLGGGGKAGGREWGVKGGGGEGVRWDCVGGERW